MEDITDGGRQKSEAGNSRWEHQIPKFQINYFVKSYNRNSTSPLCSTFHKTFDRRFAKFIVNFISLLRTWEFQYMTVNQMANFEMNVGILRRTSWECGEVNFTIALGCCFEMSAFTVQGKAISSFVRQKIIESWLEWKGPRGTQREYSSKPLRHSIVKRILVFKR